METRRNFGMIIFMVGILLVLDQTTEFKGILMQLKGATQQYWPFLICLVGLYFLCTPAQKK